MFCVAGDVEVTMLTFREGNPNDATNLALILDTAGRRVPAYFWSQYAAQGQSFFEFGRQKIRNEPDTGSYCKNWCVGEVNSELVGAFFGFIVENPYPEIDYENEPDWWIPFLELEKIASGSWLLQAISILPEHRGKGLAKEFLAKTDEVARSEGVTNITLQVEEINHIALKTYKSHGFSEIARKKLIPFSFSDDTGDIVLMRKAI